ncbi:hypothetical protein [Streptomyces sp. 6N223]|uniref:hypothetical protein n=1 Tax=Streptomyces sp. 6N223 TaxID=3457412 RepID=UPI003FD42403
MSIGEAQAQFQKLINDIKSAEEFSIRTASEAWLELAGVGEEEGQQLRGAAEAAASQPGEGLGELSGRLSQVGDFTSNTANMARQVGAQLQKASEATAMAEQEAIALEERYKQAMATYSGGMGSTMAEAATEGAIMALAQEAQGILDRLDQEYAGIMAPEAPTAPRSGGPGGSATGPTAPGGNEAAPASAASPAGGAAAAGAGGGGAAAAAPADHQAPNGAAVGAGEYPGSSTMGPEQGEFAGWHRDPSTGHLVDPATGREFDPQTGKWIDPITGKPFGEATEYATRLAGLGGGGGLASPAGLGVGGAGLAGGGGSAGMAGLYGGVLPPSIAHAGPASGQALNQAMNNMSQRANVANQMMMREAAQGGRPFMPPPAMAGMGAGGRGGRGGSGGQNRRFTDLTEDPEVWAPRQSAALGVLGE